MRSITARILSSGQRMTRMIDDMLDLTRARLAGGIPINRAPADLGPLIQRVVQEHQTAYPERSIDVQHEGDLTGDWDADRLAQMASNLIGNALQHGTHGTPVHVRLDGTGDQLVTLSVANAGAIDASVLPHLFDPFRGGQREPTRQGGLGLGLYIAQQIARSHRGGVDVHTDDPAATVFSVTVPRR